MSTRWPHPDHPARSTWHALRALGLALLLAGCGGGVDSGGTGDASFVSGTITGFGSVIVNGVRFDDTTARVTDADGTPHTRDDLRLGMTAEIHGSGIASDGSGGTVGTATSVVFGSAILGSVDAIDAVTNRIVVLGQPVDLNAGTVFDDVSLAGGLASLAVGDVVEVYALFDTTTARYTATRVERKSAVTAYVLRGVVSGLDTTTRSFSLGGLRVSYAALVGTAPAALANGGIVRVRLRTAPVLGIWATTAVDDGAQRLQDKDAVRLEGLVNAFTSATQFSVAGVAVDASAATPVAGLGLGVRVEVEGTARGTVLAATKVQVKTAIETGGADFELRGPITSADATTRSFVLRNVKVLHSAVTTEFKDGTAAGLVAGANVEVRGKLSGDGTRLLATRITFK